MKRIASLAFALTFASATMSTAGNVAAPVLEQAVVVEAATTGSSSSGQTFVLLAAIVLFAAASAK